MKRGGSYGFHPMFDAFVGSPKPGNFMDNLLDHFNSTAENRGILKFGTPAKILAIVNIIEILKLRAPDPKTEE